MMRHPEHGYQLNPGESCRIYGPQPYAPEGLACGHRDDDTLAWHHSDVHGGPVCSTCCETCNKEKET